MSSATVEDVASSGEGRRAGALVDHDVHERMHALSDLVPYIKDPYWRQNFGTRHQFWRGTRAPNAYPYIELTPNVESVREDWRLPNGMTGADPDAARRHLFDEEMITVAILNGLWHVSGLPGNYEMAGALAQAYNDWQVDTWLASDKRFRGSVQVVAHDPEEAAREIHRVARNPQIVQVLLPTVTDRQYGDPVYRPIFEAAVRNDLVVAFHHGSVTKTALGYPRYFIEWHTTCAPVAAANQLVSLIFNGLFDRYPALKVCFLEAGVAWLPWLVWRMDQQYRELKSEVPWVKRLPGEHVRDSVRVATQPISDLTPRQLTDLVELAELERVLVFASDYPHYDADTASRVLSGTLPEELRRRLRYQNSVETFPRLGEID